MANVVFLTHRNEEVQVDPLSVPVQIIDDPISALEQTAGDLRIAYHEKDVSCILKQLGLLLYYSMLLATIAIWDKPKVPMMWFKMPQ